MNSGGKLIRGEGIVCISSIDWDFIWHWQEIMLRFAKAGNPVLFVENTGIRRPGLRDIPRLLARLRNWAKGVHGFREPVPNLIVLAPLLLPFPYSRIARGINAWLLNRAIINWMLASKQSAPILWTFLPTPLVHDIIDKVEPSLVVYYCADHFAATSAGAKAVEPSEIELFRKADLVFVNSYKLKKRAELSRDEAHICPIGVNFELFDARRMNGVKEPVDLAHIPRPRFGYIGGLHQWLDVELLREIALKRPAYQFVLVGPDQADVSMLRDLPNIHLMGRRPHEVLPDYIGSFNAGLIPYRLAEYTSSVYPAKLNEYFAMGIPVISTALTEVLKYNEANNGVVSIANDAGEFIIRMDESLNAPEAAQAIRVEAARRSGWAERLTEMSSHIERTLERKRSGQKALTGLMSRLVCRFQTPTMTVALTAATLLGVLRCTPLVWRISEPMRQVGVPISADAVIVFAGGAGESGELGRGHEERVNRAIQLRKQGYIKKIVLCSGEVRTFSELEVMRAIALTQGVPDSDILIGSRGGGTHQMVADATKLVKKFGWKRVLLVSSPYHMKRAVLAWKRQQPDVDAIPTPVQRSKFYGYSEMRKGSGYRPGPTWGQMRGLLQEAVTLSYYKYRGWI